MKDQMMRTARTLLLSGCLLTCSVAVAEGAPEPGRPGGDLDGSWRARRTDARSPAELQGLLDGEFAVYRRTDEIPEAIRSAFARGTPSGEFSMADPGSRFRCTDLSYDTDERVLPTRRLVLAGCTSRACFIHYEMGGCDRAGRVVIFTREDGTTPPKALWFGAGPYLAKSPANLRALLGKKRFKHLGPSYFW